MSIKNYNLKDWITGYTLGLAGKPLPISVTKKEPVAYLYNGARLPKLPDVEGYDNAYMRISSRGAVRAYLTSVPLYESDGALYATADGNMLQFTCYDGIAWVENTASKSEYSKDEYVTTATSESTPLIWTKHDLMSIDGTIYLEASEPIPVYE